MGSSTEGAGAPCSAAAGGALRLGVDIGGTFTDFTLVDEGSGATRGLKVPTVPAAPEEGVRAGLRVLRDEQGVDLGHISTFVHGMTIGLNALLQRRGSRLALFVTEGFRDLLTMQRMRLPVPYDFSSRLPEPLIPRRDVYGIPERMRADGFEDTPLDQAALDGAVDDARERGIEGIVVCFLHSYRTPAHEHEAAARIRARCPQLAVACSSDLWPEMREYERACVAVANLYIQHSVSGYLERLSRVLSDEGVPATPFITQSNGGIMDVSSAAAAPVKTLFSGPAAGVIGALKEAARSGAQHVLTFDMGGTSTDVSHARGGVPTFSTASELGGMPITVPAVNIESIGAGGGSIAWVDASGLLKVGPRSAGSDPGPACYGKSDLPTLTDAFLLCGYVDPARFAGGRMKLDAQRSQHAIAPIAQQLGLSVPQTADAMVRVAVSNMYAELTGVMERTGADPRELSLVAYGGGGPVAANLVAEELGCREVLVPLRPGTLCAAGALAADFAYDASSVENLLLSGAKPQDIRERLESLRRQCVAWLEKQDAEVLHGVQPELTFFADARYVGQSYEIEIPLDASCLEGETCAAVEERFHQAHEALYGLREQDAPVEVVDVRARLVARMPAVGARTVGACAAVEAGEARSPQPVSERSVVCGGAKSVARVYNRADLVPGNVIAGPAIVEQDDTTCVVMPGWCASVDAAYGMHLRRAASAGAGSGAEAVQGAAGNDGGKETR